MPRYIYRYSIEPQHDLKDQGWGGAVVLLNVGIRLLSGKRIVAAARADQGFPNGE